MTRSPVIFRFRIRPPRLKSPSSGKPDFISTGFSWGSLLLLLSLFVTSLNLCVMAQEISSPSASTSQAAIDADEIRVDELRSLASQLASKEMEGRLAGTPGARRAADFIARNLEVAGLLPLGTNGTYFQPFQFNSGINIVSNQNTLLTETENGLPRSWEVGKSFSPLPFGANGSVEGEVVFTGYGLLVPPGGGGAYDSYSGLDVSNRIVIVLRHVPGAVEPNRRQELNRFAGLRYKALIARNRGARAILVVTGPNSPNPGELASFTYDTSQAGAGILAASITGEVAEHLLQNSGRRLGELQTALDTENSEAVSGFLLTNARVTLSTLVKPIPRTDCNVIGWIPPTDASSLSRAETILIGAHYDHVGRGESSGFARKEEEGLVHPGADDNASGTSAVLQIASELAALRRTTPKIFRRGLIFAFWSGEELGMIGSSHYVEHPVLPLENTIACLNFDMIGRLRDNKLILNGTGSSSLWRRLVEKQNITAGFNVQLIDDPFPPTDVAVIYPKGLPVLSFFTGPHEEYHRPADTPATLDYQGMHRVVRFATGIIEELLTVPVRPDYLKMARTESRAGEQRSSRAQLGIIADFSAEVQGVKVSGIRDGSPAQLAGVKSGDILLGLGGRRISNIHDYTSALDSLRVGKDVKLVLRRGIREVELLITPASRR